MVHIEYLDLHAKEKCESSATDKRGYSRQFKVMMQIMVTMFAFRSVKWHFLISSTYVITSASSMINGMLMISTCIILYFLIKSFLFLPTWQSYASMIFTEKPFMGIPKLVVFHMMQSCFAFCHFERLFENLHAFWAQPSHQ